MNKLNSVKTVLMAFGFFWTSVASASPTVVGVTGALSHGGELTISGTGFGTKNPAKPYLWVPFDGSVNPSPLGIVQAWTGIGKMQYNSTEGFGGSGGLKGDPLPHHVNNDRATWTAHISDASIAWNDPGQQMYLFRRTKINFAVNRQMNWKTFRVWSAGHKWPNYYIASSNGAVGTEGLQDSGYGEGGGYPYEAAGTLDKLRDTENKWQTEEILVKANTSNDVADGLFYHYLNGELIGQVPYTSWMTFYWKMRDGSQTGSGAMTLIYPIHGVLQNYDHIEPDMLMWADDVYLDTTWARIIIGNAPTLDASSHREIQIPTAWSSNSITVSVNIRSFPSDMTPYLFVINSAGEVSNGIPFQQGGATINPPTDLTVIPINTL